MCSSRVVGLCVFDSLNINILNCSKRVSGFDMAPPASGMLDAGSAFTGIPTSYYTYILTQLFSLIFITLKEITKRGLLWSKMLELKPMVVWCFFPCLSFEMAKLGYFPLSSKILVYRSILTLFVKKFDNLSLTSSL